MNKTSANYIYHLLFRLTESTWAFEKVLYFGFSISFSSGLTFSNCPAKRKAVNRYRAF